MSLVVAVAPGVTINIDATKRDDSETHEAVRAAVVAAADGQALIQSTVATMIGNEDWDGLDHALPRSIDWSAWNPEAIAAVFAAVAQHAPATCLEALADYFADQAAMHAICDAECAA